MNLVTLLTGAVRRSNLNRLRPGALILPLTVIGSLTLAACNTTAGVGRDLQKAGQKIESEAREHSH